MMKALLTLAIVCGGMFHGTNSTLAQTQEMAPVTASRTGVEEEDRLGSEDRGTDRYRKRRLGSDARLYTGVQRTSIYAGISPSTTSAQTKAVLITARPISFVSQNDTEPGDDTYGHPYVKKADAQKNYLVMYTAEWCGFCQKMYPIIDQLRKVGYIVYVVDADKHPEAVKKHRVKNLPTFIVMNQGKEASRIVGLCLKLKLKRQLKTRKDQEVQPKPEIPTPQLY